MEQRQQIYAPIPLTGIHPNALAAQIHRNYIIPGYTPGVYANAYSDNLIGHSVPIIAQTSTVPMPFLLQLNNNCSRNYTHKKRRLEPAQPKAKLHRLSANTKALPKNTRTGVSSRSTAAILTPPPTPTDSSQVSKDSSNIEQTSFTANEKVQPRQMFENRTYQHAWSTSSCASSCAVVSHILARFSDPTTLSRLLATSTPGLHPQDPYLSQRIFELLTNLKGLNEDASERATTEYNVKGKNTAQYGHDSLKPAEQSFTNYETNETYHITEEKQLSIAANTTDQFTTISKNFATEPVTVKITIPQDFPQQVSAKSSSFEIMLAGELLAQFESTAQLLTNKRTANSASIAVDTHNDFYDSETDSQTKGYLHSIKTNGEIICSSTEEPQKKNTFQLVNPQLQQNQSKQSETIPADKEINKLLATESPTKIPYNFLDIGLNNKYATKSTMACTQIYPEANNSPHFQCETIDLTDETQIRYQTQQQPMYSLNYDYTGEA